MAVFRTFKMPVWTLLQMPANAFIPELHNASANHKTLHLIAGKTQSTITHQLKIEENNKSTVESKSFDIYRGNTSIPILI